jgi:hypothetical protein
VVAVVSDEVTGAVDGGSELTVVPETTVVVTLAVVELVSSPLSLIARGIAMPAAARMTTAAERAIHRVVRSGLTGGGGKDAPGGMYCARVGVSVPFPAGPPGVWPACAADAWLVTAPQLPQKRLSAGIWLPHSLQNIGAPPSSAVEDLSGFTPSSSTIPHRRSAREIKGQVASSNWHFWCWQRLRRPGW